MRAYERLIAYAAYPTASDETKEACPSTPSQLAFGRALVEEMKSLGIADAYQNELGFVYGTLEATAPYDETVAFLAHMDVVDTVPYENIKTALIENYDGGEILLADGESRLSPAEFPVLSRYQGETLLVTDGKTLLGADDKAGVAEIMTMAETLLLHPEIPHGRIRICFTPDEEIGSGILHIDVKELAADAAYTVDGGSFGEVDYETFNAASAHVEFRGKSIHPGSAKDKMVNAARVAMEFDGMIPEGQRPERTAGRDGFFHLIGMQGEIERAALDYILRDHDLGILSAREETLRRIAAYLNGKYGEGSVTLTIRESYRNMSEKILPAFYLVDRAYEAIREAGGEPSSPPVRGGTDGSRLSFMGVPCPNLGTGSHNHHGRLEFAVTEEMDKCVASLIGVARRFAKA
ncbi:MAG: peptidase T [Clostridia bacterium]|nr:peptidase T [Clostridia bacterium]